MSLVRAYSIAFTIALFWGSTISLAKIATAADIHPLVINGWQAVIGAPLLFAYCRWRKIAIPLTKRALWCYVGVAILGTIVPGTLFYFAAAHLPAGVLAITIALVPMFTYVISLPFGLERVIALRIAGVLISLLAIVILSIPESSLPDRAMVPWVLVVVVAAFSYAVENVFVAVTVPPDLKPAAILAGAHVFAALVMTPLILALGLPMAMAMALPWQAPQFAVFALGAITAVAYTGYMGLLIATGPVFAAQTGYLITFSGVAWGMLIFGETHSTWVWASLGLILIGLSLVTPRGSKLS